jgi:drug/metabolite transporter (DMT)-like permease
VNRARSKFSIAMNPKNIAAILLIILGVVVLAYSGLSFTTPGKDLNLLGMHIATTDSHFIPPVAGALMLVVGIVLLVLRRKNA